MKDKGIFHIEIIINVLVKFFSFIRMPMLWVYDHYKFVILLMRDRLKTSESASTGRVNILVIKTVMKYI